MTRLRFLSTLIFVLLGVSNLVASQNNYGGGYGGDYGGGYGGGGNDGGNDAENGGTSTTSSAPSTSTTNTASSDHSSSGLTGDSQCPGSGLMCVTATVNGTLILYELQSKNNEMGWMAIGFGTQMANTPMVIMWPNADGTATISQRQAPAEVMPTPVATPAMVATAATPSSAVNGGLSKLSFTISTPNTLPSDYIYAFGTVKPSPDSSSQLQQHLESGPYKMDLSKALPAGSTSPSSDSSSGSTSGTINVPLLPYQKTIIAHAIVVTFGFLFLLPAGALLARYTRTYSSSWFKGHWILQGPLGGMLVVTGVVLGIVATNQQGGSKHSRHKSLGLVLLALYLVQSSLGIFIHYVKISFGIRRPPQNYVHAILGLSIIGLSLYQVRLGYSVEWPTTTGRGNVPSTVNIVWMVWAILLPVLYFGGLAYLPRQLRQEKGYIRRDQHIKLEQSYSEQPYSERSYLERPYSD